MKMQRWFERAILVAAAMLAGAAPMLFAQGQQLFEWSGRVDREVQISMRGNRVSTRSMDNNSFDARERSRVFSSMPRQDGQVIAQVSSGRGRVDVIQQPSSQNGYTTVVRIQDPGSGSENYRVTAYWQPYANGEYGGRNRGHEVYGGRGPGNGQNGGLGQVGQGSQNGNRSMMHWSGNVDGQLEIRLQNGRASYRTLSGAQPTAVRMSMGNMSMARGNAVSIAQNQGRGSISVIQQPSSSNGYVTVIRINDPQGGAAYYDFDLLWQ